MKNINSKIIIIVLVILVLGLTGYIVYDKVLLTQNNNENINDINNNESINNTNANGTLNQDTKGKIYIKRNGIIALEEIPADIVGKYVHSENKDDYFILNSDGTAMVNFQSGDNGIVVTNDQLTYQLTYNENIIVLELYTNAGPKPFNLIMMGDQHISDGGFATTRTTPSANIGTVYTKVNHEKRTNSSLFFVKKMSKILISLTLQHS